MVATYLGVSSQKELSSSTVHSPDAQSSRICRLRSLSVVVVTHPECRVHFGERWHRS